MKEEFKVAMLQLDAIKDSNKSLRKGIEACKKAKKMGADLAVFPEMWNIGYEMPDSDNVSTWMQKAITENDEYLFTFQKLAKEINMAIAITFLEKTNDLPKNTIIIYNRFGKKILKYSKIHTVDFKMEKYLEPGTEFYVSELDYERGKVTLGAMICFDRDFPESTRILMLKGAEIIIVPNACFMTKIRLEQLKVRAYENMVGIITVNYSSDGGKSSAYSPIVRDKKKKEIDSEILVMADKEDIQIVKFDLKKIRDYRKRETLGDAYRKPSLYGYIKEEHVKEPFIREDARRNLKQV